MSGLAQRWAAALDAIERDVTAAHTAMRQGGVVPVSDWRAPEGLGPVPADLRPRAVELVARLEDVRKRCEHDLGELSGELGNLDRRRDAGSAYAAAGGVEVADTAG